MIRWNAKELSCNLNINFKNYYFFSTTVCGERDQLQLASSMILNRIKDDPQSASCPNLSYQNITGLIANANPVGSPFAPVVDHTRLYSTLHGANVLTAMAATQGLAGIPNTSHLHFGLNLPGNVMSFIPSHITTRPVPSRDVTLSNGANTHSTISNMTMSNSTSNQVTLGTVVTGGQQTNIGVPVQNNLSVRNQLTNNNVGHGYQNNILATGIITPGLQEGVVPTESSNYNANYERYIGGNYFQGHFVRP